MVEKTGDVPEIPSPSTTNSTNPYWGFAVVAWLWFFGVTLFWVPSTYVGLVGGSVTILAGVGWIVLFMSFVGAIVELTRMAGPRTQLDETLASLVLFSVAGGLHWFQSGSAAGFWTGAARIVVWILVLLAALGVFRAISGWVATRTSGTESTEAASVPGVSITSPKPKWEFAITLLIALLNLAAAIVKVADSNTL